MKLEESFAPYALLVAANDRPAGKNKSIANTIACELHRKRLEVA